MTVRVDKEFECNFVLEAVPLVPAVIRTYCYPGAIEGGVVDGVAIVVTSNSAESWSGTFAKGGLSFKAPSIVGTCPDRRHLYVVSRGEGYLVDSEMPTSWQLVPVSPIFAVTSSMSHGVLLFISSDRVLAMSKDGIAWKTGSISFDGISLLGIEGDDMSVEVWDAPTQKKIVVKVNLQSGSTDKLVGPGSLTSHAGREQ